MLWVVEVEAEEEEVAGVEAAGVEEEKAGRLAVAVWQDVQPGILQGRSEHRQAHL